LLIINRERGELGRLKKLKLLLVSLTIQRSSKVKISDNTVEYYTSKIFNSIISNMNFCQIQGYGTYC
jgi:hypothetical protein